MFGYDSARLARLVPSRRRFDASGPRWPFVVLVLVLLVGLVTCDAGSDPDPRLTLRLLTGSESRNLYDSVIKPFEERENVTFEITYKGSVDTMLEVQQHPDAYDAVWPASSIWISLSGNQVVTRAKSIMATPTVFAVKRPVAERLGWVGRDVTVEEILAAVETGQIRYMMTSATQSNSGAMAYLGYLYAFAGQPQVLTSDMLHDPEVVERTKRLLGSVDRLAGASGFLMDVFKNNYGDYDALVNYESAVIAANQELTAQGRDPLYAVYPVDGLAIADWSLGYIDHGDAAKSALFDEFQAYLLSKEVQQKLLETGRRTGPIPLNPVGANPAVFNPFWGIDLNRVIVPITLPSPDVIREALDLYQTALRKPSFTVFCLDFSGSMQGSGEADLTAAMATLLDPDQAARYFLQTSTGDITIVIPFNEVLVDRWRVDGNDPARLRDLLEKITDQESRGGTNIYSPVIAALDAMSNVAIEDYSPAIILMTDGRSNRGRFADLQARQAQASPGPVPVYAILFGDASEKQLTEIAEATTGDVFDGRTDLVGIMRTVRGYN